MRYVFLAPARDELNEAVTFYNLRHPGLGDELASEVEQALERIERNPVAFPRLSRHVRRCRIPRFPYSVLYQVREREILVVAVMHLRRDPTYWRNRIAREQE